MRDIGCGCFPTGLHYPGIADRIARAVARVEGLSEEFGAADDWRSLAMAVIDFETTGLDAAVDRVLEVGVVLLDAGEVTGRHGWLVNPGIPVPEESRKVHGITDEELSVAPHFDEVFGEMAGLLAGRLPVAYNAEFDKRFLLAEFGHIGGALDIRPPPALRPEVTWVDPLVWVRELQKYERGKKLTDVCARMGIEMDQAHRATADAEAAAAVLLMLSKDMPRTYGELIRIQARYAAQQDAELAAWRARRKT